MGRSVAGRARHGETTLNEVVKNGGYEKSLRPDQGARRQIRGLPVHRPARQVAAHGPAHPHDRRIDLRRRGDVRRLVDRRLEGHLGLRHVPDARPRHRLHRPVRLADPAHPVLRHDRADHRPALRARPPLHRQARRGLPQGVGHRRHRRVRPRARVLRVRRRAVQRVDEQHVLFHRRGGRPLQHRPRLRGRQRRPSPGDQGRLLPGAAGRTPCRTCAPRCSPS